MLREARRLTLADVASAAGTNEAQVIRIEKGEIDTRGSLLLRIVQVVQGRADDLLRLITSNGATAEEGRGAARKALRPAVELSEEEKARFLALSPEQRRLVIELVDQMRRELQ